MVLVEVGGIVWWYKRLWMSFFFQAEDGIRDFCLSRGLGDVYNGQPMNAAPSFFTFLPTLASNPSYRPDP